MIINDDMDFVFYVFVYQMCCCIFDLVCDMFGQSVGELVKVFDVSWIVIMNYFKVFEDVGLFVSQKDGWVWCFYFNVMLIQVIYERWIDMFSGYWVDCLSFIKYVVEGVVRKIVKLREDGGDD